MAIMGVSSITPAFPKMIDAFRISPQQIGLLITLFTLPGIFLTPMLGVLADQWGRKRILVPSLFLFGIAGAACTLIRNFHVLLLFRLFQGIGGAALGSLNVTIIGDLYDGRERSAAMGYNASVLSVGTASYPVIGGAMALFGWYFPFLLPLLAIPVGLGVLFGLRNPEPKLQQHLRTYLKQAWQSIANIQVIGLFVASIVTFIILYGSYLTYLPLLIDIRFGGSSLIIGVIMSSMSFTTAITSSQLGNLTTRFREQTLLKVSFVFYTLALIIMPFVSHIWLLLIPTVLFGIGHGLNIPNIQTLLAGWAPMDQRAIIMSLNGMVLRTGQTLGPITIGAMYAFWGINGAFLAGAGFAAAMFLGVVLMIK